MATAYTADVGINVKTYAMRKYPILIICTLLILITALIMYFSIFNGKLSINSEDWDNFGGYLAGTVGVLFSLFSFILIYFTFFEQRMNSFENTYHQLVLNYNNMINLIHERWLHTDRDKDENPIYRNGREIFGNAIGYINGDNPEEKFIKIFSIHINVFQHYINYLVEVINTISENNDIKETSKKTYYRRFSSQLSFYELMFIAYYAMTLLPDGNIKSIIEENFLFRLSEIINKEQLMHKKQFDYIIEKIKH